MKLEDWLKNKGMKRADFARSIGVSPGAVTQFCNQQGAWISRETATMILRETKGAVTPNDFLGLPGGDGPVKPGDHRDLLAGRHACGVDHLRRPFEAAPPSDGKQICPDE